MPVAWRIPPSFLIVCAFTFFFFRPSKEVCAQAGAESQIRALENRFADGFRAKDVDKIMTSYERSADLAFFDVVPRREYLGWDAYKKDWQGFFASIGPVTLFEIKGLTVKADGDLGYGYSFQHYIAQTKAGGSRDVTVRVTDVYRKIGGRWLIVQEHVSVPVDPQSGKGDFGAKP